MNVREQVRLETHASADVFLTSPWIPAEWVKAHGLEPRAAIFAAGFGRRPAPLGAGICAFAESTVQFAKGSNELTVVFTSHCDQLRRAFDTLPAGTRKRCFLFNLPATTRGPAARRIFRAELERLGRFLLGVGGRAPEPCQLEARMVACEIARVRLRDAAAHRVGREYASMLKRFHWNGSSETPAASTNIADRVRLAVIGGPLGPDNALWKQIEASGADVVLNASEWGERSLGRPASPAPGPTYNAYADPLERLTDDFFQRCIDVFQRPNESLYDWFLPRLEQRRARGIIVWHYFGCDLWRAEAQTLRQRCAMPLLVLEADESGSALERQCNRVQAFVEALK